MTATVEGVTLFENQHSHSALREFADRRPFDSLLGWRSVLFDLGLLGQDANRYDGASYGNVSMRLGPFPGSKGQRRFLVSGTQTGHREQVDVDNFALVERYDLTKNRVISQGLVAPSSESLTHGAFYDIAGHLRCVLHVHSPVIFRARQALKLPTTPPGVDYGTVEMARSVKALFQQGLTWSYGLIVMAGHEDGIIGFGRCADEAGLALMTALARAHAVNR